MIERISLLRNVGKFDNVTIGAADSFAPMTVIYAENGRGKTTIAAILRSLSNGNPGHILERRRLTAAHDPHIVINLSSGGTAVFQNSAWTQTLPELKIFDDTFVTENVCAGTQVGPSHRQNLHELIIGAQGISLNNALQARVEAIEGHNKVLREHKAALTNDMIGEYSVDTFCNLQHETDIGRKIEDSARNLSAAKSSVKIAETATFNEIKLPEIDLKELSAILSRSLKDIDAEAMKQVEEHLSSLGKEGEDWVIHGLSLTTESPHLKPNDCPFCAQSLDGSPVLKHYRSYFGEEYLSLIEETNTYHTRLSRQHGELALAIFEKQIAQTELRRQFWKDFAEVSESPLNLEEVTKRRLSAIRALLSLLDLKKATPHKPIELTKEVTDLVDSYHQLCREIELLNSELQAVNPTIDMVKEQTRTADATIIETDLKKLKGIKRRYDPAVIPLCDAYLAEKAAKALAEQGKTAARTALDTYRTTAFPAYGAAINDYLIRLNAAFRVGPVDPVNNRNGSSANYSLLIDGLPVPLVAAEGEHCFRNTLSAGDRNTLALAFFFASIELSQNKANAVVVFDDPMTSLDEHRTLVTLHEIESLARQVARTIVLSHSKPFLLGVWDQCRQIQKKSFAIIRAQAGSTITTWNVSDDMITEHDHRFQAATAYLAQANPAVERRVAEALRPMLEVYVRVAYPNDFPPDLTLGPFYQKCIQRIGTPDEILPLASANELRNLLDYANRYHHDTNQNYAIEAINDAELENFTRRVIKYMQA